MIDRFPRHHQRKVRAIAENQLRLVDRCRVFSIDMLESRNGDRATEIKVDEGVGTLAVGRIFALWAIIDDVPDGEASPRVLFGAANDFRCGKRREGGETRRLIGALTANAVGQRKPRE